MGERLVHRGADCPVGCIACGPQVVLSSERLAVPAAGVARRVASIAHDPLACKVRTGGVMAAHRLVHGLHEAVDCPIADLDTVDDPLLDRLPEVEPDEDA